MSNDPINELQGKNIAIVAMGQSQIDFHLSQTHSVEFDEVWAINAMIGVLPNIDRAFILQGYLQIISDADYTFQLGADNTLTKEDKQAFYRIMNQTKNTDKIRALEAISKMMGLNEPEVIEHKHTVKTYKTNWG